MKILATFALLSFCVMGCHHNKPAQTPVQVNVTTPPPVQGPPP